MKIKFTFCAIILTGFLALVYNCKKEALKTAPTVTISAATNITATTATSGGDVTADGGVTVTSRGVCWSTNQNPTTSESKTSNSTGTGSFTSSLTGLTPGATYYLKAYAINSIGTAYSSQTNFTTLALAPVLTTTAASAIASTSMTSGGNITNDGGSPVTSRGVCWSTTINPTTAGSKTTDATGSGSFTSSITGLTPGTTYYIRAYATNSIGTAYGNELSATTAAILPVLTTTIASAITSATAISGGNITNNGGATITARGVCWSTTANPTTSNSKSTDGTGTGSFTSALTGLAAGITYYLRAYATNSVGTAYGNEVTFSALVSLPSLTTTSITSITSTNASSGGNITSAGGGSITARGVCWGTTTGPTTASSKTSDGTGTGSFTSTITGLTAGTSYSVRAYATNSAGTVYGDVIIFNTLAAAIPTIATAATSNITSYTATCGGNVTYDNGANVTARGVCWSTSQNPTIANSKTTNGSGTGSFSSNITGLAANTTYYVRAYAVNSIGTAYGSQVSFKTYTAPNQYGFYIGQLYGGGIIFYIDGSGQHGLIAADKDQSSGVVWGCFGTNIPGLSTAIGTGSGNTSVILTWCLTSGTAAYICANLVYGYDDWYLPSKDELNQMYLNRDVLGTYAQFGYWSSSQSNANDAWGQVFGNGTLSTYQKVQTFSVRAIRAF